MDSTVNIESNHINIKSFVDERIKTFELVLSELEAMSKKSKDYFVKTLTKDNRVDNARSSFTCTTSPVNSAFR